MFVNFLYLKKNHFKNLKFLLSFFLFILTIGLFGQQLNRGLVYDFSDDWQVYNFEKKTFLPAVGGNPSNALSLVINLQKFHHYNFSISFNEESYVYVNYKLIKKTFPGEIIIYKIDSLKSINLQHEVLITIYKKDLFLNFPKASIIYNPKVVIANNKKEEVKTPFQINKRQNFAFRDFLVLTFVFLLITYAFLLNFYPRVFEQYYQLKNIFGTIEKTSLIKALGRVQLIFILNHSFLLSFGLMIFKKLFSLYNQGTITWDQSLPLLVYNWFGWALVIFCLILGKYILINLLGNLIGNDKIVYLHFYRHISLSQVFYPILIFSLFFLIVNNPGIYQSLYFIFWILIIAFQLVRSAVISIGLNKIIPFYNMYFFSYLCATEAIPVLLGFKYFSQIL